MSISRYSLFALLLVASCKKSEPAKQAPVPAHSADSGSAAGTAPASAPTPASGSTGVDCKALPPLDEGMVKSLDLDLDGDGTKDVTVGPEEGSCGSEECPHTLYLSRGKCFEPVGDIDHVPEVLTSKHNGLFDVKINARISGETVEAVYEFDGKKYVARK